MSSTYAHYQAPSSLPSDYAILSFLSSSSSNATATPHALGDAGASDRRVRRRESIPATMQYYSIGRPQKPTMGVYPRDLVGDEAERTPLLAQQLQAPLNNPPVPRIEESVDRYEDRYEDAGAGGDADSDSDRAEATGDAHAQELVKMFWEELRILTRYALPVFGTHLFEYSLVITSVISIGHISTTALAAISLGSMTASVTAFSVIQGGASALDTLLPAAWTGGEPRLVGLWAQRMTVVMFACLIPMLIIWSNAESILLGLKQEPEVAHLAAVYLKWVGWGLPAYAFNCISRRYFQSQGLFTVPTRIVFVVAPVNALLNWFLVWGPPRLGFIGAPIATAISFNLIAFLSIIYGIFYTPSTAWYPLSSSHPHPYTFPQYLSTLLSFPHLMTLVRLGLSGVGQTASEWWAWELVALAASLLGPVALATQSVLLVSASTTFQAPFALGVATSVRIGNLLGEQKAKRAGVAANTSILMAFMIACFSSTLFLVFRNKWAYMFNSDPQVVALVASIMPLLALFQVFDATSAVTGGILRARGSQFLGALLNLSAYYVFGIPLGVWLAFDGKGNGGEGGRKGYGLHGLWMGLTFSLVYCAVVGTGVCVKTDWEREVGKVKERIRGGGGGGGAGAGGGGKGVRLVDEEEGV